MIFLVLLVPRFGRSGHPVQRIVTAYRFVFVPRRYGQVDRLSGQDYFKDTERLFVSLDTSFQLGRPSRHE